MINYAAIKSLVESTDAVIQRPWQLYVNGSKILQNGRTNPRIRNLSDSSRLLIPGISETARAWEVRLLKTKQSAPFIKIENRWELSFDNGLTRQKCRCLQIRDSVRPGEAWQIILEAS